MAPEPGWADSLIEQMAVEQVAENEYMSTYPPARMGNTSKDKFLQPILDHVTNESPEPIAYGGCTTALAVNAACKTVAPNFHLYSVLGYFLGPSLTDRHVKCFVHHSRDTKSFATRRVVLSQLLDNGTDRKCLELIADFQIREPATAMEFLPPTIRQYKPPTEIPSTIQLRDQFVSQKKLSQKQGSMLDDMFALQGKFWEQHPCPEGVTGQNMMGFGKALATDQDHLGITEKFSAEWMRAKGDLPTEADQVSALAFNMDGGLSFIPLIHDHQFLEDVGACSSLDFALRIFTDKLDMTGWHVKERKAIAGEGGRTYSEARIYDARGNLVAIESQQSIMRPLGGGKKGKL